MSAEVVRNPNHLSNMHKGLSVSRQRLLTALRGRQMIIPDLEALFYKWPQATNPELELLSQDMDIKLKSCVAFHSCHYQDR